MSFQGKKRHNLGPKGIELVFPFIGGRKDRDEKKMKESLFPLPFTTTLVYSKSVRVPMAFLLSDSIRVKASQALLSSKGGGGEGIQSHLPRA